MLHFQKDTAFLQWLFCGISILFLATFELVLLIDAHAILCSSCFFVQAPWR